MKKYIPFFLLSFLLLSNSTNAFWWNNEPPTKAQEKNIQTLWDDPFFDDPFFGYHPSFFNRWHNPIWNTSFPRISVANNYPLDLEEKEDQLVATIDIPHFSPEDIEIEVKNDRWLIVKGQKEAEDESENDEKKYYYRERSSGSFSRQVLLPHPVDKSKTKADYKDGTLTITLPKKSVEAQTTNIIPITSR